MTTSKIDVMVIVLAAIVVLSAITGIVMLVIMATSENSIDGENTTQPPTNQTGSDSTPDLEPVEGGPTTEAPTFAPTFEPTTEVPTFEPTTEAPTFAPTFEPTTEAPTFAPTFEPTEAPTFAPTFEPTTEAPTVPMGTIIGFPDGLARFRVNNGNAQYALDPNHLDYCHLTDPEQVEYLKQHYPYMEGISNLPSMPDEFVYKGKCGTQAIGHDIIMGGCTYSTCPESSNGINNQRVRGDRTTYISAGVISGRSLNDCKDLANDIEAANYWTYNNDTTRCALYKSCDGIVHCDADDNITMGTKTCVIS